MPLEDRVFSPWSDPIAVTGLLFIWVFMAAFGALAMRGQRSEIKRLVDDLTTKD
jgi:hypothetical protein